MAVRKVVMSVVWTDLKLADLTAVKLVEKRVEMKAVATGVKKAE